MGKALGNVRFVNKDKNLFFVTLKKRIDQYFADEKISKHANSLMIWKTIILLSVYLLPFVALLIFQPPFLLALILWFIMGLGLAGVGMSIMHDAIHGAYSQSEKVNKWLGYSLNLCGGSIFNWRLQHNVLHHTYTNVLHLDDDINDKLVLKFSPHTEVKPFHRFQTIYAFFFYGILTLYWVTLKDFIQFEKYIREGVNKYSVRENAITLTKIIILKFVYFFTALYLPIGILNMPAGEIVLGFLLMHFAAGIILTVAFQLAHAVEGTDHPLPDENGNIDIDWAIHQLRTTANFSPDNKFLGWYLGGLNYQVEHHLFPRISHVHYPVISPIVRQTAEEFGIPYMQNQTFMQALRSHLAALKKAGTLPDINEALSG